jgi:hypothetical protein
MMLGVMPASLASRNAAARAPPRVAKASDSCGAPQAKPRPGRAPPRYERPWPILAWTGDVGTALFAAACLDEDARYPILDIV